MGGRRRVWDEEVEVGRTDAAEKRWVKKRWAAWMASQKIVTAYARVTGPIGV